MKAGDSVETASLGALWDVYLQRRYAVLFYTLFFTMVAPPVLATFGLSGILIECLLAANLLAAVMPVSTAGPRHILIAVTLVVWIARPLSAWFDHPVLSAVTLGVWTSIGLFAAASALRFAMGAKTVDAEHLYAALSAYLLAGIFFGLFYWALEQVAPGTFSAAAEFTRVSALYFSFVTLATLGYGDIVPRTDVARGLAIVEGVGGQLFLAVMVARLVSLYTRGKEAN
jgi:hypothetical protein